MGEDPRFLLTLVIFLGGLWFLLLRVILDTSANDPGEFSLVSLAAAHCLVFVYLERESDRHIRPIRKVIIIDAQRLADLMIEHDIGVSTVRTIAIKRVDTDYFEES